MRPLHASLTTALLLSASPAMAASADDLIADLQELAKQSNTTLTVGETESSGDDFVFKNVTVKNADATGKIAEAQVTGYSKDDKRAKADKLNVNGIAVSINENALSVTVDQLTMTDINMPASEMGFFSSNNMFGLYTSQTLTNLVVNLGEKPLVIAPKSWVQNKADGNGGFVSETVVEDTKIELGNVVTGPAAQMIGKMGYETLTARASGTGSYDPGTGVIESDDTLVEIDNAMAFKTSYRLSGYTEQFLKQMAEWDKTYSTPEAKNGEEAVAALMPMLNQVKIDYFSIELKDDSLTGKLLEMQANQMGTTPEQLAEMAPMFIGMPMAQLQMPEFTQMVTGAVGGFLKDKGTLTIALKPKEPVSMSSVISMAQTNLQGLPELLGVSFTSSK